MWGGGGGRVAYGYDLAIIRAKSADGAGAVTWVRTGQSGGGGPVRGGPGASTDEERARWKSS